MKKKFLSIALCAANILYSQDYNITKGSEIIIEDKIQNTKTFATDSANIYSIEYIYKGKGTRTFLSKINVHNPRPVYLNELHIEDDERHVSSFLTKSKILVFTKKFDFSAKEVILFVREYNISTGSEIGTLKKISSISSDAIGTIGRNFYLKFSPDKSKLMIVSEFQWKKKPQEVVIDIYDSESGKKLSVGKTLDTFNNALIENLNYAVDNAGNALYLFKYEIGEEEKKKNIGIGKLNANGKNQSQNLTTNIDIELMDCKIEITEDNNLIVGGVFLDVLSREDKKNNKQKNIGVFAYFVNTNDLSLKAKNLDYFNSDIINKLTYVDGVIDRLPSRKYYKFYGTSTIGASVYFLFAHVSTTRGMIFSHDCLPSWPYFATNISFSNS